MRLPLPLQLAAVGALTLVLFSAVTAIAATNTVPATRSDRKSAAIGINDIKPAACAGISLTNLITGAGTITGTDGNDLILAGAGADNIDGLGGNDCILGGGGDDSLTGGDGGDICLGGPGTDTFTTCEGETQ